MQTHLYLFIVIVIYKMRCQSCTCINRLSSGDIFEASCNSCHLYNAQCAEKVSWFACCTSCACENGATKFGDMCYSDLSHTQFDCKLFLQDSQWYGLPTNTLRSTGVTTIGKIVYDRDWNPLHFESCVIKQASTYWDTTRWHALFTGGRKLSDFFIHSSLTGVTLKFNGDKLLYDGLLIKLSITCLSYRYVLTASCLAVKFAGKRQYLLPTPPSSSPTFSTTSNETTITTIPHTNTTITNVSRNNTQPLITTHAPLIEEKTTRDKNIVISISCVSAFVLLFCCIFMIFRRRRSSSVVKIEKAFLVSSTQSYESASETVSIANTEFEQVNEPTYTDFNELKLLDQQPAKKKDDNERARIMQDENRDNSSPMYYSTINRRDNRSASESQDSTRYTPVPSLRL